VSPGNFITYIGEEDFHDGRVVQVRSQSDNVAVVLLRGQSGKEYEIEFRDVETIRNIKAENMILYAISEMATPVKLLFVFVNWDEQSGRSLEIVAQSYEVRQI
jgi:hypothetical protein